MKLLIIDVGNSCLKYCIGDAKGEFPSESFVTLPISNVENVYSSLPSSTCCAISSVNTPATEWLSEFLLKSLSSEKIEYLDSTNSPMELMVQNPEKLGPDRIAAAIAAFRQTQSPTIVIDSGTATTVDLVDEQGRFRGGSILPGIRISIDALDRETSRLPTVNDHFDSLPPSLGDGTVSAIRSGVFWGHVGGVERIVNNLQKEFGQTQIVVTGGFGRMILDAANFSGVFCGTLVLQGLWHFAQQQFHD